MYGGKRAWTSWDGLSLQKFIVSQDPCWDAHGQLRNSDAALSRRKHGFESRWACQIFTSSNSLLAKTKPC